MTYLFLYILTTNITTIFISIFGNNFEKWKNNSTKYLKALY